jgi:hypothetical protein
MLCDTNFRSKQRSSSLLHLYFLYKLSVKSPAIRCLAFCQARSQTMNTVDAAGSAVGAQAY